MAIAFKANANGEAPKNFYHSKFFHSLYLRDKLETEYKTLKNLSSL